MADADSPRPWPLDSSELEHEYPIFGVFRDRVRSPRTGQQHDFYVVRAPDAVVVVAVTAAGELVMVEQYRHGVRRLTLELPAGLLDEDEPLRAARRELREETGYEADDLASIGLIDQNPSWETTRVHVAVAHGAARTAEKELDAGEDTRVRLVARDRLHAMISSGEITSAIAIAALYLFEAVER